MSEFDFGFTLVDEEELESVQLAELNADQTNQKVEDLQDKVDELFNAITPLLNNLKANPEKEYIKWPNRIEKVEAFEDHIRKIYQK